VVRKVLAAVSRLIEALGLPRHSRNAWKRRTLWTGQRRESDNAYTERFFRVLKDEKFYLRAQTSRTDLYRNCVTVFDSFNQRREYSITDYLNLNQTYSNAS